MTSITIICHDKISDLCSFQPLQAFCLWVDPSQIHKPKQTFSSSFSLLLLAITKKNFTQEMTGKDKISQNGQIFCQIIFHWKNKQAHLEIKVRKLGLSFFALLKALNLSSKRKVNKFFAASNKLLCLAFSIDHTQ